MGVNYLTYGGFNTSEHGVYISGKGAFNAPEREIEAVEIPGKSGNLILDMGRYLNIEVTYPAFAFASDAGGFRNIVSDLRSAMCSKTTYQRLTDTYNPDEFRMALYKGGLEVSPVANNIAGGFDLVFDCMPQRFLVSGETPQTFGTSGTITNPTRFPSMPLIQITGKGDLGIGAYSFTIRGVNAQTIYIDCETMEAWEIVGGAKISRNDYIQYAGNSFPVLDPGNNGVTIGTGITSVVITPRWWTL